PRCGWYEIDLGAVAHNTRELRRLVGKAEAATIEVQEVEGPQAQLIRFGLAGEQAVEIRQPGIAACDKLGVDDCFARRERLRGRCDQREVLRKVVTTVEFCQSSPG